MSAGAPTLGGLRRLMFPIMRSMRVLPDTLSQGVGYAVGAGGAVTQATDKSTGVTLNKMTGQITLNNASLAAGAEVAFTVTNSFVQAGDIPVLAIKSGAATAGTYDTAVAAVADGSFVIAVTNLSAGALGEALVISFAIIKGSAT